MPPVLSPLSLLYSLLNDKRLLFYNCCQVKYICVTNLSSAFVLLNKHFDGDVRKFSFMLAASRHAINTVQVSWLLQIKNYPLTAHTDLLIEHTSIHLCITYWSLLYKYLYWQAEAASLLEQLLCMYLGTEHRPAIFSLHTKSAPVLRASSPTHHLINGVKWWLQQRNNLANFGAKFEGYFGALPRWQPDN